MSRRLYELCVLGVCDLIRTDSVSIEQNAPLWFFRIGLSESGRDGPHDEFTIRDMDEWVIEYFDVHVGCSMFLAIKD